MTSCCMIFKNISLVVDVNKLPVDKLKSGADGTLKQFGNSFSGNRPKQILLMKVTSNRQAALL